MTNELLLVISATVDVFFVFIVAKFGPKFLFSTIILNLILINIFGAKIISVFNLTTNVSNIFYACVFLATHFIIEKQDKKEALKTIWFGTIFSLFSLIISQLAVYFVSVSPGDIIDTSIRSLFPFSARIAIASISAFVFAQYVNIKVFYWLKNKTGEKKLWLRSLTANILGQLLDSCIFFTIAFIDLSGTELVKIIFAGWIIKNLVGLLGIPFLYIDKYFLKK